METNKKPSLIFSIRFLIAVICFWLTAIQYMQRTNLSVAIVCMVNNTIAASSQSKVAANASSGSCPAQSFIKHTKMSHDGRFLWIKNEQGNLLSAFFAGYIIPQIAGGYLSMRFGPKIVLIISMLAGSLITLLTPFAANYSYNAIILCRFLVGLANGFVWPAMNGVWPFWGPPSERSTLIGFSSAGSQIGNVITFSVGGFLCSFGFENGWPSIFYSIGVCGILWCLLAFFFLTNSPQQHKLISSSEKSYIIEQTKDAVSGSKKLSPPWLAMLSSKPMIALLISHACSNYGTYLFLTQLPSYMNDILKFDIKSNGALSSIPYISFWMFTILSGILSDKLIQNKVISRTASRKIFNTMGFLVPIALCIGLLFVSCANPHIGVVLMTFNLGFTGCLYGAGFLVNFNDVAGSFSGIAYGISNTIGTISGIVAPSITGAMTKNKTQEEWIYVFIKVACIYVLGAFSFLLAGSGELQPWAVNNSNYSINKSVGEEKEGEEQQLKKINLSV